MMQATRRRCGLVILALVWLLLAATACPVQAQGDGAVEGQVVNGTIGGPEVGAGLTVTLNRFRGDAELDPLETTTDADGHFRFEGLDPDGELDYWLEVSYLGVPYSNSTAYRFGEGQTDLQATVTVYETTGDDAAVTLDSVHIIIESFEQVLRISEIHLFGNSSDRTFVGRSGQSGQLTTVRIPLPSGAVGLAFQEEIPTARFFEVEDALLDTEPVPPGSETALVFFSYHLIVTGETIPLERSFAYPVHNLSLLVAQPGLTLRSDQLQAQGTELFQGRQYEFFAAQGLAAGTPLSVELVPQAGASESEAMLASPAGREPGAATSPSRGNQELLRWFGLALAILVALGALVYTAISPRPAAASLPAPSLQANPVARELLAELADLEDAFEAGQVDQVTYDQQRAEKYEALRSL